MSYSLSVRDIQRLLAAAGYYKGGIDGDAGPKTYAAADVLLSKHATRLTSQNMNDARRLVAAAQLVLFFAGHEPGTIDGFVGHNTAEAFNAWEYERAHGKSEDLQRDAGLFDGTPDKTPTGDPALAWPRQADLVRFYGPVGTNQTSLKLPYAMRLAWDTDTVVTSFTCHEKAHDAFGRIFANVLSEYGEDRIKALRLDMFGGCFNVRKMRGGSSYSTHSWGIAVDLDPANNQLRWGRDRASFARPDYDDFWRIVAAEGALSLGIARNYDWMHFQFARL